MSYIQINDVYPSENNTYWLRDIQEGIIIKLLSLIF
jgi:hypothetical protein